MHQDVAQLRQDDRELARAVEELPRVDLPPFYLGCQDRRLTWWPEIGIGYYPVEAGAEPYDEFYFQRYTDQANTDIGKALMKERVAFVDAHYDGELVDIGIGSGAFVELRNEFLSPNSTFGYDINPVAKQWLEDRHIFIDPYQGRVRAISLWDVLEHIPDFKPLLAKVTQYVFLSIPIFDDCEHILRSKHYRKDEHVWYFTTKGIVQTFEDCGFELIAMNTNETEIGRDGIGSFAFRRNRAEQGC